MPRVDGKNAWRTLSRAFARYLHELIEGDFIIISHRHINYYVQVAAQGEDGFRIEAVNNTYIVPPSAALTTAQYARMSELGWRSATEDAEVAKERYDPEGSPNFFRQVDVGEDLLDVADVLIRTLHEVYGIATPALLDYHAFHCEMGDFPCPDLRLTRRVDCD